MGARRRSWLTIYALGAVVTLGALLWISVVVLRLERSELRALAAGRHQEAVRLALWRMDSWFGPQLTREVARLPLEYRAYSPQSRAYTRILNKIEPGEVLVPSPLLTFESEILHVHFQVDREGWTSPQCPTGNWLDLAMGDGLLDEPALAGRRAALAELTRLTGYDDMNRRLSGAEASFNGLFVPPGEVVLELGAETRRMEFSTGGAQQLFLLDNVRERQERASALHQTQIPYEGVPSLEDVMGHDAADASSSSALVPLWLEGGAAGDRLCFVRRVRSRDGELFQGFLVDWERLREVLLERVADLLPGADLDPQVGVGPEEDHEGLLLATVPATLRPGALPPIGPSGWTPAASTLLVTWVATLVALGAVGIGLRSSIRYGEQRSRFASTVTHELRTPLTTFRMYSEMLARGMVPEERRGEYLATLERESDRLTTLVENVLAYSRLEEGRGALRREAIGVGELLERVVPGLERRAREAGMTLLVDGRGREDELLRTDPEAVGQILFNLVDNACKYGRDRSGSGGTVELSVVAAGEGLSLRVRDHGKGVPPGCRRAIFRAFDRGGLDSSDPNPGVGLGLALSRGLARDLGGELSLESGGGEPGADFRLSLPLERRCRPSERSKSVRPRSNS